MSKFLADTNIIIYHLAGEDQACKFITDNIDKISISFITYIEVLSFDFTSKEEKKVRNLLNMFTLIESSKDIIEQTVALRKLKKIKLPDCLIAATALVKNLVLVTRNMKDFDFEGLVVVNPFNEVENE